VGAVIIAKMLPTAICHVFKNVRLVILFILVKKGRLKIKRPLSYCQDILFSQLISLNKIFFIAYKLHCEIVILNQHL